MLQRLASGIRCFKPFIQIRNTSKAILRDYQQDAIDCCVDAIKKGTRRIGVSMATGGGKTVIFSNLIEKLKQESGKSTFKTLVLVHRRELAQQAGRTIKRSFPNKRIQMEMGKQNSDIDQSDVIIASIQSLIRRLDKYKVSDIDLIIIDEAHHAAADSYIRILKHFNAATKDTKIPVVGFSATFERADNKALSDVIDEIVYHRGMLDMINDKWLCEGKFTTVKINADLSKVEKSSSSQDFKIDSLSRVMNVPEVNEMILTTYLQKRKESDITSTLLFCVDIAHVMELHKIFDTYGIKSKYVTSNTKAELRDQIIKDFKDGKIEVLMNCGIFTEGTDMPNIDCILLARPTRSRSLLVQMIGRGLRLHHSKDYCHIIDFVDSSDVGIVSIPTLVGIKRSENTLDEHTLEELQRIKEEQDERRRILEEKVRLKLEKEKILFDESYNKFKDIIKNTDAMDLTMTTYESLSQFYEKANSATAVDLKTKTLFGKERELIGGSKYVWVKFNKCAWALSLHNGSHLRLYLKPTSGIKGIESSYSLKLYREIPKFLRHEHSIKFSVKQIAVSNDLFHIISKVEEVMNTIYNQGKNGKGYIPTSRYSKWRNDEASDKQQDLVSRFLKAEYSKHASTFKHISYDSIERYTRDMNKGTASDILFARGLAPTYVLKQLLKALDYKKRNGC